MSFEVEVKYRTSGHAELAARLLALGGVEEASADHEDAYLSHPARNFAETDEALRIRRVGALNRITYKGPKRGGPTKTREELEIPFAEGDESLGRMLKLFENLGFRTVAVIRKTRRPFRVNHQGRRFEVALDLTEQLGEYAEVETIAPTAADLPDAQAAVLALSQVLGLHKVEPRSYLRMALEHMGL